MIAREALCFSPLVKAGGADAPCVEGIPLVSAGAEPFVLFARRPVAQRAADARVGRMTYDLLFVEFFIQNNG